MRILPLLIIAGLSYFLNLNQNHPHGSGFKISCSLCHSTKGWYLDREIYAYDHNTSSFSLSGQHSLTECRECHKSLVFSEAPSQCIDCHTDIHQNSVGSDCSRCHSPESWLVKNITEIHNLSRFPLLGAHRTADCYLCHKSESLARFDVPGIECIDCHRQDYLSTTIPNHAEAGFSEDCTKCHPVNALQWQGAGFNHNFFPLVQGHLSVQCKECHTTERYSDANPECISCHYPDYQATVNPNHLESKFPLTCTDCHDLKPGWKPASFDHSLFPLTLGHSLLQCTDCHIDGDYISTPNDCYSCHNTDYSNTSNPVHSTLDFSTVCTSCHTTNPGWKPASYKEHDSKSFPIYSGRHKGTWTNCSECHENTSNYSQFTCLSCHAHNKTDMDNEHREENGYSYTSSACLHCHPTGNAE
ncbi:MAG: hypothetical protein V1903_05080 [Bacteroidota bacterium]